MKIFFKPVRGLQTQGFGLLETKPELIPEYAKIGLNFGHNGYDYSAQMGEKLYFNGRGTGLVLNTEIDGKGGLGINIIVEGDGKIFKSRYWHLKEFKCSAGDIVESGDLIGLADNTGWSTGSHLHWELKEMIKDENGAYKIKDPNNGYFGCVSPAEYLDNTYIMDFLADLMWQKMNILQKILEILKRLLKVATN